MGPAFFAALAHVRQIHANCKALLRTHHQRAGGCPSDAGPFSMRVLRHLWLHSQALLCTHHQRAGGRQLPPATASLLCLGCHEPVLCISPSNHMLHVFHYPCVFLCRPGAHGHNGQPAGGGL